GREPADRRHAAAAGRARYARDRAARRRVLRPLLSPGPRVGDRIAVRAAREPAPESARDPARRRDQGAVRLGPALRLHHLRPRARRERPGGGRGARGQGEGGRAQRRVERPPALAIPRGEGARVARFLARARREDRRAAAPRGEGLRGGERAALPRELEGLSLQQRLLHVRADRGRRGRARAPPPARRVWHRHDRDRRPRPPDRVLVPGSRRRGDAVRGAPPGGSGTSFHLTIRTQAGSVARRLPEACKSQLRSRAVRVSGEIPAPRGVTLKTLKRRETVAAALEIVYRNASRVQNRLARSTPRFRPQARTEEASRRCRTSRLGPKLATASLALDESGPGLALSSSPRPRPWARPIPHPTAAPSRRRRSPRSPSLPRACRSARRARPSGASARA